MGGGVRKDVYLKTTKNTKNTPPPEKYLLYGSLEQCTRYGSFCVTVAEVCAVLPLSQVARHTAYTIVHGRLSVMTLHAA